MSLLSGLNKETTKQAEEKDTVGFTRLPSDFYKGGIKMAYLDSSAKGSVFVRFELEVLTDASTTPPTTRKMTHTEYISYAGGEFTKDGKTMRGLGVVNGLSNIIFGKDVLDLEREKKTIKVWEDGKEQMREKEVITEFIGEKVGLGIIHKLVDNTPKSNDYKPDGTTKEVNEIDKFFDVDTQQTSAEKAKDEPATFFAEKWSPKYITGEVFKEAKGKAEGKAASGAQTANPSAGSNGGGALFG